MQETPGADPAAFYAKEWHVDSELPMSEDCLYLNVWTPANRPDEKLPVMVWIFGGGMTCGYPSEMEMDGERLARRGIVVVSINYRLNVFGFLAHPELTAENPDHFSGNYGFLDQQAGIQWVHRNISAFGGDPTRVTLAGQSAGGRSVMLQSVIAENEGLFQRTIVQSGGGMVTGYRGKYVSLSQAESYGEFYLREVLGVNSIAKARTLPAAFLRDYALKQQPPFRWGPIVDGHFLREDPTDAIAGGRQLKLQCLTGSTTGDLPAHCTAATLAEWLAQVQQEFGADAQAYLALCKPTAGETLSAWKTCTTYNLIDFGSKVWAGVHAHQQRPPMYLYRFGPTYPGDNAGAFHSSELWFMFETLAKCWRPFTGRHYDLARQMCNYWANFVKNGNPNGPDADGNAMPFWQPCDSTHRNALFFGDTVQMDTGDTPAEQRMNFLVDRALQAFF